MNSVMIPADFIEEMVFELHVEDIVNDHQLQRIGKAYQQPCVGAWHIWGNCEGFDGVEFV